MTAASDEYTGEVTPGGAAAVRHLPGLTISKLAVDPSMANNCYLLRCETTGEQVLIDAADDAPAILELIGDGGLTRVITTHQHWDHHRALADVVAATGAATVAGAPDAEAITEQTGVSIDRPVQHGDEIAVGARTLEVLAIAGHTPGSIALHYRDESGTDREITDHLFTGDSLFPGGVGATFGDDEAFAQLIDEVETKIFGTLPDSTWYYPGHGSDSNLGVERPHLSEWRERGW